MCMDVFQTLVLVHLLEDEWPSVNGKYPQHDLPLSLLLFDTICID